MSSIFGEVLTFSQEKGPDVKKKFGDEFTPATSLTDTAYLRRRRGCSATQLIKGQFVSSEWT
jgi:hypothetical protein